MGEAGEGPQRIQKYLSRTGVASRRAAERLMLEGRVKVNGTVVTTLGERMDPARDVVEVDGKRVRPAATRWLLVHKPTGVLSTAHDPRGGRTVFDLLPREARSVGLAHVGRLDKDTSGLLLLTNEGGVANRLLHPRYGVEREYRVGVRDRPGSAVLRTLRAGVELDDGPARVASVRIVGREPNGSVLALVLREGRKREVRRLCKAVGHDVRWLHRVRFGPIELGDLGPGRWRRLRDGETAALRERAGQKSALPAS